MREGRKEGRKEREEERKGRATDNRQLQYDDADDDDWEYALAHCNDDEDTTHPVSIWKGVAKTLEF